MAVDRLQAIAVVQYDAVAIDAEILGPHHAAVVGGLDRRVLDVGKIEAEVHLLIHLLTVIDVIAHVGENRFLFTPMNERAAPKHLLLGLKSEIGELPVVLEAYRPVDIKETRENVLAGQN